ncbi:MAG: UPF0158 family protein [Erysipelotrichaceae bacterium]|nr:UPF0158 family protein [Erysipelotrichaceae bacterium]
MIIDLDDIIDAIQGGSNQVEYYLNTHNGEIIMRDDSLPTRELMEIDDEIDKYYDSLILIPTAYDANQVGMMRRFTNDLPEGQAKDALNTALSGGKGLYRRFKNVVQNYNLDQQWYEYEDDQYVQFAKGWCEENEVAFEEVPKIVYRHATRRDVDLLVKLKKKELNVEDDSLDFELNRYFSAQVRNGALYQIIAWWKNKVAATGAIAWVFTPPTPELPDGRTGYLCNFWIDEELKNQGYEKEIIKRLEEEARRRKLPEIRSYNLPAELVEGQGFVKEENVYKTKLKLK